MGNCLSRNHALWREIHVHQEVNLTPHHQQPVLDDGVDNRPPDSYQQNDPCRPSQTEFDPNHQQFKKDPNSSLTG